VCLTRFVSKGVREGCCTVAQTVGKGGANACLEIEPDFSQERIANVEYDGSRQRQTILLHQLLANGFRHDSPMLCDVT
jgi:hypothetical protein